MEFNASQIKRRPLVREPELQATAFGEHGGQRQSANSGQKAISFNSPFFHKASAVLRRPRQRADPDSYRAATL